MERSDNLQKLLPDLIKVKSELKNPPKDKQGYGYKYTDLATIIESTNKVLAKNNLVLIQSVRNEETDILIETAMFHTSGEFVSDVFRLPKTELSKANEIQKMGASITYGRRYAMSTLLGIASEDDTDGVTKTVEKEKSKAPQKKEPVKEAGDFNKLNDVVSAITTKEELNKTIAQANKKSWEAKEKGLINDLFSEKAKSL